MQKLLITICMLCIHEIFAQSCDTCDSNGCPPPHNCLAGIVHDSCDCCFVCGRREGERCDNAELNLEHFGKCGDNLECVVRDDLHWDDPPEATCSCTNQTPLCGSDGVTYENKCQLMEERNRRRDGLRAISAEPCVVAPTIIISPQNVRNRTGGSAVMVCEAKSWPTPTIEWMLQGRDGLIKLPGNNTRLGVQTLNGHGEKTSWLLFLRLQKEDEGTYVCEAANSAGLASATAKASLK